MPKPKEQADEVVDETTAKDIAAEIDGMLNMIPVVKEKAKEKEAEPIDEPGNDLEDEEELEADDEDEQEEEEAEEGSGDEDEGGEDDEAGEEGDEEGGEDTEESEEGGGAEDDSGGLLRDEREKNKHLLALLEKALGKEKVVKEVVEADEPAVEPVDVKNSHDSGTEPKALTREELDELTDDPGKLVSFIRDEAQRIARSEAQFARQQAQASTAQTVVRMLNSRARVSVFYKQNADVARFANIVNDRAMEIETAEPSLSVEKILEKAANSVREDLGIEAKKSSRSERRKKKKRKPAFVRGSRSRVASSPKLKKARTQKEVEQTELQDDIQKLADLEF